MKKLMLAVLMMLSFTIVTNAQPLTKATVHTEVNAHQKKQKHKSKKHHKKHHHKHKMKTKMKP